MKHKHPHFGLIKHSARGIHVPSYCGYLQYWGDNNFLAAAWIGNTAVLGQWLWLMSFEANKLLSYSHLHNKTEDTTISPSYDHFNFYSCTYTIWRQQYISCRYRLGVGLPYGECSKESGRITCTSAVPLDQSTGGRKGPSLNKIQRRDGQRNCSLLQAK